MYWDVLAPGYLLGGSKRRYLGGSRGGLGTEIGKQRENVGFGGLSVKSACPGISLVCVTPGPWIRLRWTTPLASSGRRSVLISINIS